MINCIIVDDEPLAIQLLESHISKIESLKLIGTAKNAMDAYKILQSTPIDLMFLDIEMPDLNGIDFLKSLHKKPKTIFTTAYREFAIEGFELEAVDYILKPISFERFFKAVDRVLRKNTATKEEGEFIILKSGGLNKRILLEDIVYFESCGNDVKVIVKDNTSIIAKDKISELDMLLSQKGFVRVHRSFLINSQFVTAFNNDELMLGKYSIPVGRTYKKEVDEFITDFSKKKIN
ncbi:LytR/AlgR family response regulator transcription factor [Chryseobacterium paridis]|uniref:Response regulator transcription factor n=1 Tax=Chryseobacterium paridis TaxID=2800328 RepID=A0ABS1FQU8_9FLAO|nr:LytTR family DNA-binding domain-containing protein [Chryseobacterium paridis]MBK1894818.1 response regulator transcription factor [Chryseobacterium paridis]